MKLIGATLQMSAAAALIGLAAASTVFASRELTAAMVNPGEGRAGVSFWSAPNVALPMSSGSRQQRRLLGGCLSLMASQEFAFQAAVVRSAMLTNCSQQARHAQAIGLDLAEIPTVLAIEQREAGNLVAVDRLLQNSRALAPTDLAMILHRIRIGFSAFTPEELARPGGLLEAEMPVLIGSGRGVSTAASLYVQVPQLRPIVDRLADELPALDRQRFLGALRRQIRG